MKIEVQVANSSKFDNLSEIVIFSHLLYANGTDGLDALLYTFRFVLSAERKHCSFFHGLSASYFFQT